MQNFSPFSHAWKLCTYSRATPPPCSFPSPCVKRWKSKDKRRFKEFNGAFKDSVTGADHLLHTSTKTTAFDSNESSDTTNKDGKNGFLEQTEIKKHQRMGDRINILEEQVEGVR
ncbi:hypothetical protein WA026_013669 [Henosepilachna vigintioctopunctata]|uniref:Uncharacterized protein n=1 Tax=Henosepilachna vigintioctopunctata TaxID=420089 RepID=A0AAW1V0S3_9CUCU